MAIGVLGGRKGSDTAATIIICVDLCISLGIDGALMNQMINGNKLIYPNWRTFYNLEIVKYFIYSK